MKRLRIASDLLLVLAVLLAVLAIVQAVKALLLLAAAAFVVSLVFTLAKRRHAKANKLARQASRGPQT